VAVKSMLIDPRDPDYKIGREMELLLNVRHPNLVKVGWERMENNAL